MRGGDVRPSPGTDQGGPLVRQAIEGAIVIAVAVNTNAAGAAESEEER